MKNNITKRITLITILMLMFILNININSYAIEKPNYVNWIRDLYDYSDEVTDEEIDAVAGYQDLTNPQSDWMCRFPENKSTGSDCYMINGHNRGTIQNIFKHDAIKSEYYSNLINSAIHKYYSTKPITLYRGYANPTRMYNFIKRNKMTNDIIFENFVEDSFTSCSEKYKVADFAVRVIYTLEHGIISRHEVEW